MTAYSVPDPQPRSERTAIRVREGSADQTHPPRQGLDTTTRHDWFPGKSELLHRIKTAV